MESTTRSQPSIGSAEYHRLMFLECGLPFGRNFGSKTGYVRSNPGCKYIANACVYTKDKICCWRGDLDIELADDRRSLIEASKLLGRKLFVLREQTIDIRVMPTSWLDKNALFTVWQGQVHASGKPARGWGQEDSPDLKRSGRSDEPKTAMNDDRPIEWHGVDLAGPGVIMLYRGEMHVDPIRDAIYLRNLPDSPMLDQVLRSGDYQVEIRVIRRLRKKHG